MQTVQLRYGNGGGQNNQQSFPVPAMRCQILPDLRGGLGRRPFRHQLRRSRAKNEEKQKGPRLVSFYIFSFTKLNYFYLQGEATQRGRHSQMPPLRTHVHEGPRMQQNDLSLR